MQAMVSDHSQAVTALQRFASSAQSAEVRMLASSGVTVSQQHLATAQLVAAQVGATSAVATVPPVTPTNPITGRRNESNNADRADGHYALELSYGHIMEERLAQIAQKRAKNKEVKQFADRMADDFGKWRSAGPTSR